MHVMHNRAASLDVHKQSVVACRMRTTDKGGEWSLFKPPADRRDVQRKYKRLPVTRVFGDQCICLFWCQHKAHAEDNRALEALLPVLRQPLRLACHRPPRLRQQWRDPLVEIGFTGRLFRLIFVAYRCSDGDLAIHCGKQIE